MRTSRVVFAGIAVAAAAATTSAFTASNTGMGQTDTAGYGENTATGAVVTNVAYVPSATDGTYLQSVDFTVSTNVSGKSAELTLKSAGSPIHAPYACTMGGWGGSSMTITCAPTVQTRIDAFTGVGLTIVQ
jgi:hypothetical protein